MAGEVQDVNSYESPPWTLSQALQCAPLGQGNDFDDWLVVWILVLEKEDIRCQVCGRKGRLILKSLLKELKMIAEKMPTHIQEDPATPTSH